MTDEYLLKLDNEHKQLLDQISEKYVYAGKQSEATAAEDTSCQMCQKFMVEPVMLQCTHRLCLKCLQSSQRKEKRLNKKSVCLKCRMPIKLKILRPKDLIDRNYQQMIYTNDRANWDKFTEDAPKVAKNFLKYLNSKEKQFNSNYEIMELIFVLKIEHHYLGEAQTIWHPKPQHLWIYSLSFDDKCFETLLPHLFLTVKCLQGKSCGDYLYLCDSHTLQFQCLTYKYC